MSALKEEFSSIDDLLGASLDDLADLPAFEAPPPGAYILGFTFGVKKINEKDAVEMSCTVKDTVELEDKSGETQPVANGTKFSNAFFLDNKFAIGNLKKMLKPFGEHFGTTNIGQLIRDNLAEEVTASAIVKNRADKNDPEKVYASVNNISVV